MHDDTASLQTLKVDMLVKRLQRLGPYAIKQSPVGWWVDGCYGYLVAGYYASKKDAVISAVLNIKYAKEHGIRPSWMFS